MRILWFTNTSSCYQINNKGYNGGGWISSLEIELNKQKNIELAVCFYSDQVLDLKKEISENGTFYYIIPRPKKTFYYTWITCIGNLNKSSDMHESMTIPQLLEVVNDYNPNIIQVFGSENVYGLIAKYVKIPVILHVQGILNPSLNAFLPPFVSWKDYICQSKSIKGKIRMLSERIAWERNCVTERKILRSVKYFMGRTKWDKCIVSLFNPDLKYYECDEILRDTFYRSDRARVLPLSPIFVTTISSQLYKGFDILLKTAKVLKDIMGIKFEWRVYGDVNPIVAEKICKISHEDVNVRLFGIASAEDIKEALLNATAYVHTSYIDNSPNSLCEASLLGVSSISTNVGGISSLIEDGKTGFLVPSNDPYQMAYLMSILVKNTELNIFMGEAAREIAMKRHNRVRIANRVLEIYNDIIKNEKS